jgi:hypothetical protein
MSAPKETPKAKIARLEDENDALRDAFDLQASYSRSLEYARRRDGERAAVLLVVAAVTYFVAGYRVARLIS